MSPEQLAKMQAGAAAARALKGTQEALRVSQEQDDWHTVHQRWADEHFVSHPYVTRIR